MKLLQHLKDTLAKTGLTGHTKKSLKNIAKTHKPNYSNKEIENVLEAVDQQYNKDRRFQEEMHKLNGTKPTQENEQLIQRVNIENTPFEFVNKGEGWFIGMSPFILTPTFEQKEEALQFLERNKWNIIINIMASLIELDHEGRKNLPE